MSAARSQRRREEAALRATEAENLFAGWCDKWANPDGEINDPQTVASDWRRMKPPFRRGAAWLYELADKHSGGAFTLAQVWFEPVADQPEPLFPADETMWEPNILPTFRAAELAGQPVPERQWHVPDLIPSRTVSSFMADGGSGKSTLATQLSVATVLGSVWLGRQCHRGPVLMLNAEDDREELHPRLIAICRHAGVCLDSLEDLHVIDLAGRDAVLAVPDQKDGQLRPTELMAKMRRRFSLIRPVLLVLDNLADVFGGDEIKKHRARQFITLLRGLAVDFNTAVLLIAHPSQSGMASGAGTAGTVAWSNSVKSRLYLERVKTERGIEINPDVRILSVKKANYGPIGQSITLRWQHGVFVEESAASEDRPDSPLMPRSSS